MVTTSSDVQEVGHMRCKSQDCSTKVLRDLAAPSAPVAVRLLQTGSARAASANSVSGRLYCAVSATHLIATARSASVAITASKGLYTRARSVGCNCEDLTRNSFHRPTSASASVMSLATTSARKLRIQLSSLAAGRVSSLCNPAHGSVDVIYATREA